MGNKNTKCSEAIARHLATQGAAMRLQAIRIGLGLEVKIPGMRMTRKAPKCSTILRREFGLSGAPARLLAQFEAALREAGVTWQSDREPHVHVATDVNSYPQNDGTARTVETCACGAWRAMHTGEAFSSWARYESERAS